MPVEVAAGVGEDQGPDPEDEQREEEEQEVQRDPREIDVAETGRVFMARDGIARVYGLEAGTRRRPTRERIESAMETGVLSRDVGQGLIETYRFLLQLRLKQQLDRVRAGEEPTNSIRLARLSSLEHRHLKDAFQAIREMQAAVARRYRTDALG